MALIHLLDGYTLRLKRTRYADRQQCRIRLDELSLFKGATPLEHLVGVEPERTSNLSYARLRLHRQLHNVSLLRYRSPPADLTPGAHLLGITHAQMIIPAASLRQRDTPYAYVAAGQTCTVNMIFTPGSVGTESATLALLGNSNAVLAEAGVTGIGQSPSGGNGGVCAVRPHVNHVNPDVMCY